jgi:hypothetical protein
MLCQFKLFPIEVVLVILQAWDRPIQYAGSTELRSCFCGYEPVTDLILRIGAIAIEPLYITDWVEMPVGIVLQA